MSSTRAPARGRRAALAMILAANVLGGLSYAWQGLALEGLPPATITLLRNGVALACLAALMVASGESLRPGYTRSEWGRVTFIGLAAYALPLLLGIAGIQRSGATHGALLILLEPAAILVLSRWLLGEHIRALQWTGIGLGALGAAVIATEGLSWGNWSSELGGAGLAGNLCLIASAVTWGLYSPVAKPLAERHPAAGLTFWTMAVAMIAFVPAALAESGAWRSGPDLASALIWTVLLGVLVSCLSIVLWVRSLRHLQASLVAGFVFIQPVAGGIAGHFQLGERLSGQVFLGGAIIALGVAAVMWPARSPGERNAGASTS